LVCTETVGVEGGAPAASLQHTPDSIVQAFRKLEDVQVAHSKLSTRTLVPFSEMCFEGLERVRVQLLKKPCGVSRDQHRPDLNVVTGPQHEWRRMQTHSIQEENDLQVRKVRAKCNSKPAPNDRAKPIVVPCRFLANQHHIAGASRAQRMHVALKEGCEAANSNSGNSGCKSGLSQINPTCAKKDLRLARDTLWTGSPPLRLF
jgi:hypothetical protein